MDRLRLEGRAALAVPGHGFFWQLTAGGRWQRDLDGELPTVSGTVLGTAGWLQVTKGVDAGLAHRSATGWLLDLDGWSRAPDWQHEIGLFVRLRGGRRGAERYSAGPAGFSWW